MNYLARLHARFLGLIAVLAFAGMAHASAQGLAPDALIRSVSDEVLEIIRKDKDLRSGNTQKALNLIETKVLPHFNFVRMTRLALGRDARQATPEQIDTLANEFRTLLVRTYSKALTEYRDQEIVFRPFSMNPGDTEVRVRTEIRQSGGKPIPMDYYLEKTPAGWKVYDVEVSGASLVISYRSSFQQEIQRGGIEALISSLRARNRGGDGASSQ